MKSFLMVLFVICSDFLIGQQVNTGIVSDNYIGSMLSTFNPSSIVDSKTKFSFTTNMNISKISNFASQEYFVYGTNTKFVKHNKPGFQDNYLNVDILNVKYEINHQNAIGYTFRIKSFSNLEGLSDVWSENAVNKYMKNITGITQDITGLRMSNMNYTENVFTYARVIYDRQTTFLKAGASLKLLNGINGNYFYANNGLATFYNNNPNLNITNLDADFGQSISNGQTFSKNRGIGLDLGFTYEFRPDFEQQYYEMDGETKLVKYDINKYKWKFSGSITDIGAVRYVKNESFYNFSDTSVLVYPNQLYSTNNFYLLNGLATSPYDEIANQLQSVGKKSQNQESKFRMNLPTSLHLNFDYNIKDNFYVSYNVSAPLSFANDKTKISNFFIQTITPRIEKKNYTLMLPISQMGNGKFYFGAGTRVTYNRFALFGGSNNLSIFYGKKASLARNFFVGISFNIYYKNPSDIDFDTISDEKDECPNDIGTLEFYGCPDSDGDKIIDKEDNCIYEKGPKSTGGCPDADGDGIIDMNDMCPTEKGLHIHYGCPDKDFDGVIDAADKCPDVAGIELNNGCPFENPGCCMDNDGDGVSNNVDKCPDFAGSIYNDGCPIDSLNINSINLREEKNLLDANNTAHQSETLEIKNVRKEFITSEIGLNEVFEDKNVISEVTIYFDFDQATLNDEEQQKLYSFYKEISRDTSLSIIILGFTDKDGSLDYNLTLSKKRSDIVKRKLIDLGFTRKRISVYYYGETKLIHSGSYTKEMKKADRKVEIKLVKQI
jgi:outer membrane protein OmpA-like peptidoglycan-associated protein